MNFLDIEYMFVGTALMRDDQACMLPCLADASETTAVYSKRENQKVDLVRPEQYNRLKFGVPHCN